MCKIYFYSLLNTRVTGWFTEILMYILYSVSPCWSMKMADSQDKRKWVLVWFGLVSGGGGQERGKERLAVREWKVNRFPRSRKSGVNKVSDSVRRGAYTLLPGCAAGRRRSQRVFLQKLECRHWDFLPQWLFSCPKDDMKAEVPLQIYMGAGNGHLSAQVWTQMNFASNFPRIYSVLSITENTVARTLRG